MHVEVACTSLIPVCMDVSKDILHAKICRKLVNAFQLTHAQFFLQWRTKIRENAISTFMLTTALQIFRLHASVGEAEMSGAGCRE